MATIATTTKAETPTKLNEGKPDSEPCCCPEFTKERFDALNERIVSFDNKPFVKERVWCLFHIPLNFGRATTRAFDKIEKAGAAVSPDDVEDYLMLADLCSPWVTHIYVGVSKSEIPNAEVVKLSGTFRTKVFEGPYSDFGKWIKEMKAYVVKEEEETKKRDGDEPFNFDKCDLYANYIYCPGCAKKFGHCYTVLYAKVD